MLRWGVALISWLQVLSFSGTVGCADMYTSRISTRRVYCDTRSISIYSLPPCSRICTAQFTSNGLRYSNAHHQGKQKGQAQLSATDNESSRAFIPLSVIGINDRHVGELNIVWSVAYRRTSKSSESGQPREITSVVEAHDLSVTWETIAANYLFAFL